jgi:hypothetical protein
MSNTINTLQSNNTANYPIDHIDTSIPEEIFIAIIDPIIDPIMSNLEKVKPLVCVSKRWNVTILTHVKGNLKKFSLVLCTFCIKNRFFNNETEKLRKHFKKHINTNHEETVSSVKEKTDLTVKRFLNGVSPSATPTQVRKLYDGFKFKSENEPKKYLSLKNQSLIPCKKILTDIYITKQLYYINTDRNIDTREKKIFDLIKDLIQTDLVNEMFASLKQIDNPPMDECIELLTGHLLEKFNVNVTVDFVTQNLDVEEHQRQAFTYILDFLFVEGGDPIELAKKMSTCPSGIYYITQIAKKCALRGYSTLAADSAQWIPIESESEKRLYLALLGAKHQGYEVGRLIGNGLLVEASECAKQIVPIKQRDRALCGVFGALIRAGLCDRALSTINALSVAADFSASEIQREFLEDVIALLFDDNENLPEEFSNFPSWKSQKKQELFAHVSPSILFPFVKDRCVEVDDDEAFDLAALISNATQRKELYSFIMNDIRENVDQEKVKGYIVDTILVPLFERGSSDQADEMLSVLSPEDQESYGAEIQDRLQ